MSTLVTTSPQHCQGTTDEHEGFLSLMPVVKRHAQIAFRNLPSVHREEAVAEAVAAAFESYVALKSRGQDPVRDFPSKMASFAVLHVKDGRHVGGRSSSRDVLSRKAQQKHGFRVEPLPRSTRRSHEELNGAILGQQHLDTYEEMLQDTHQWPVPDRAAFRVDFPAFLQSLSSRDRQLLRYLAEGNSGKLAARKFKLSPGRVTQLRQQFCREWHAMHGEAVPA
jgi:DNA-binding NarL/FixJ family response regulator